MHNTDEYKAIDYRFLTLEADRELINKSGQKICAFPKLDARSFHDLYGAGYITCEDADGIETVQMLYKEIIPVHEDFTRNQRRVILRSEFSYTANQCFSIVLDNCAQSRDWGCPDQAWIREQTKHFLKKLNQEGLAHSIEIYGHGELYAGIVGIQCGGVFIGLSIYTDYPGAGNAAFVAMLALLSRNNFVMIDALVPSQISRAFGGDLMGIDEHRATRQEAVKMPVCFPVCPVPRPVAELLQPR